VAVYRDQAIVLRTQKLGEADRIITLFTKEHGRLRAVAKGVRRTKSKFGARLEPTSYVDLQLYAGKTFDIVTQAEGMQKAFAAQNLNLVLGWNLLLMLIFSFTLAKLSTLLHRPKVLKTLVMP